MGDLGNIGNLGDIGDLGVLGDTGVPRRRVACKAPSLQPFVLELTAGLCTAE